MSGSTDAGRLLVRIEATTAQLRQQLQQAEQQVGQTQAKIDSELKRADAAFLRLGEASKSAQQAVAGIAGRLGPLGSAMSSLGPAGAAAAAGIVALGAGLAKVAVAGDEAQAVIGRLKSATGSLEQARSVYASLYALSQQTGVSVAESAGAFSRFAVAAKEIGGTNDQILKLVSGIQKAGLVAGTSAAEANAAVQQLGQALASGTLQGDELRSVLENMPQLAQQLARELGVGIGELRKMGSEGKLTADIVFPALLKASEKMSAEFDKLPPSMSRSFDILGAAMLNFTAKLDEALGLSQAIARAAMAAANAVNKVSSVVAPSEREQLQAARQAAQSRMAAIQQQIAAAGDIRQLGIGQLASPQDRTINVDRLRQELAGAEAEWRRHNERLQELQRDGEQERFGQFVSAQERAAQSRREAASTAYRETRLQFDKEFKLREEAAKQIAVVDKAAAEGAISAMEATRDRARINKDLQESLDKLTEAEKKSTVAAARGTDEAEKAANKRQAVIDKLDAEVRAASRAIGASQQGAGASREMSLALEIENRLREAGIPALEKRTDAEKKAADAIAASVRQLDGLKEASKKADEAAKASAKFHEDSWNELASIGERAFERLGDAMVDAFVSGKGAAVTFANAAKGIMSSIVTDLTKLAVVNPIMNSLFVGTNGPRPTLGAALGGGVSGAAGFGLGDALGLTSLANYLPGGGIGGAFTGASNYLFGTPATYAIVDPTGIPSAVAGTPGVFGTGGAWTLGGVAGAAGLGFGAGQLVNAIAGGNQLGGTVGSALGTGAGLAAAWALDLAVPGLGTALAIFGGAAGGGIGGLFGPGPSVQGYGFRLQSAGWGPDATPTNEMASSLLPISRQFYNDSGAQMFQAADQLVAATNAYLAARGLTVGGVSVVGGNKNGADYSWADAGNLNEAFTRLRFGATDNAQLATSLQGKTFSDLSGLQQWVEGFLQAQEAIKSLSAEPVSALETQITNINNTFQAAIDTARKYGLEEAKLVEARDKAIADTRKQVADTYDAALREADGLGVVNQILAVSESIKKISDDLRAVGRDPEKLAAAQIARTISGMDLATFQRAISELEQLDPVAARLTQAAWDVAAAAEKQAQAADKQSEAADKQAASAAAAAAAAEMEARSVAVRAQVEQKLLAAIGGQSALRAQEMAGLDTAAQSMLRLLYDFEDAQTSAAASQQAVADAQQALAEAQQAVVDAQREVDVARAETVAGYQQEAAALDAVKQRFAALADQIAQFRRSLATAPEAMLSPEARLSATRRRFQETSRLAALGNEQAISELPTASSDFLAASKDYYASSEAYFADFAQVQAALTSAEATARRQAGVSDQQLARLNDQIKSLGVINSSVTNVGTAVQRVQMAQEKANAMAAALQVAQNAASAEATALRGVQERALAQLLLSNTLANDVKNELRTLNKLSATPAPTTPTVPSTTPSQTTVLPTTLFGASTATVRDLYQQVLGRQPDLPGLTYWQQQYLSGINATDLLRGFVSGALLNGEAVNPVIRQSVGLATGGSFTVGGPAGNDNLWLPQLRLTAGETVSVSRRDTMQATASATAALVGEFAAYRKQSAMETMALQGELLSMRRELADTRAVLRRVAAA